MIFGLDPNHIESIRRVFRSYPQIEQAIIYGSRAKGNEKKGSDIDLTLKGKSLDMTTLNKLSTDLDDLLLVYHIDLSIYDHIDNPDLIEHIRRVGKIFYEKSGPAQSWP